MITLTITPADALTMLRSGKLTAEALGDLQSMILAAMTEQKREYANVRLAWNRIGSSDHKIEVIKQIRRAVEMAYPDFVVGLKDAKDFVEGRDVVITMPENIANNLRGVLLHLDYDLAWYVTENQARYMRKPPAA